MDIDGRSGSMSRHHQAVPGQTKKYHIISQLSRHSLVTRRYLMSSLNFLAQCTSLASDISTAQAMSFSFCTAHATGDLRSRAEQPIPLRMSQNIHRLSQRCMSTAPLLSPQFRLQTAHRHLHSDESPCNLEKLCHIYFAKDYNRFTLSCGNSGTAHCCK